MKPLENLKARWLTSTPDDWARGKVAYRVRCPICLTDEIDTIGTDGWLGVLECGSGHRFTVGIVQGAPGEVRFEVHQGSLVAPNAEA